jgi:hypothetical protein
MSTLFDVIWDAIVNKRQILARYHGHPRTLCPHILGYKDGKEHCLFYQCGGTSRSGLGSRGSADNWRCMDLDELDDVSARDGTWYTAFAAKEKPQTCVDQIVIAVKEFEAVREAS